MSSPAADATSLPTVYFLYGEDDFAIEQDINRLLDRYPDETSLSMNVSRFDGASVPLGRIIEAATSAPFLADRRLAIVYNAGKFIKTFDSDEQLVDLLESVPPGNGLVLLDRKSFRYERDLRAYQDRSPLLAWAAEQEATAYTKHYPSKSGGSFVLWVREHAAALEGEIDGPAAQVLAEYVADDPYLADQELRKLLDFVNFQRPIQVADIERLSPLYGQTSIFDMVDALGGGDVDHALRLFHQVMTQDNPRYVFSMVVRQFRLLLQARAALDNGQDPSKVMRDPPFVIQKATAQARRFQLAQVESILQRLIELDIDSKTRHPTELVLQTGLLRIISDVAR